jgi:hypothetical protein
VFVGEQGACVADLLWPAEYEVQFHLPAGKEPLRSKRNLELSAAGEGLLEIRF